MKKTFSLLFLIFQIGILSGQKDFSFAFLPDIHLQADSIIEARVDLVINQINKLKPDFVITGGDMIYTAKNVDDKEAEKLFDLMDKKFIKLKMPVYYTMGNHEIVGITLERGINNSNPLWGKRMFESRYGPRYKSFEISGWKFFILDGIKILEEKKDYTQEVDSVQLEWIKTEILKTDKNTPIVIVIHPPLINPHAITNSRSQMLSRNSEDVLNTFKNYNLKMVLQGHTHTYMNLLYEGIHYVSGGSTSKASDLTPFDDGFLFVKITKDIEDLQFIPSACFISKRKTI